VSSSVGRVSSSGGRASSIGGRVSSRGLQGVVGLQGKVSLSLLLVFTSSGSFPL
jgi:hypothetical protein